MSSGWQYRIVRLSPPSDQLVLREVYCDDSGAPRALAAEAATFGCVFTEGAKGVIQLLEAALAGARERPVIDEVDIPEDGGEW